MAELKRSLSLTLVILYGLGTILGAGIYVLTGVVAEKSGFYTPIAFVMAAIVASLTALSFAELSSRFPNSAGESSYVFHAFQKAWLSRTIGWMVVFVGTISSATIARGFLGYLHFFVHWNDNLVMIVLIALLVFFAAYGILESVAIASAITLIEVLGLVLVILSGFDSLIQPQVSYLEIIPKSWDLTLWSSIFSGAAIAFFAFIGFEDIVNIAEEAKNPKKNLPKAILWSLIISTSIYFLIALIAIQSLPMNELAGHSAPMAAIIEKKSQILSPQVLAFISLLAVVNGALIQIIMASRVIYGMAKLKIAPPFFAQINEKTKTPIRATFLVGLIILGLSLLFKIEVLAELTSFVTLIVFSMVNLSLIIVKLRKSPTDAYQVSLIFPLIGLLSCLGLLLSILFRTLNV